MNIFYKISSHYFSNKAAPYWIVLLFDCLVVVISMLVTYTLYQGASATAVTFWPLVGTLILYLVPYIVGFRVMHTYQGVVRYSGFTDLYRVAIANFIGIAIIEFLRLTINMDKWLVSINFRELLFSWLLATVVMVGTRIVVKYLFDLVRGAEASKNVFIYGCKAGGLMLAKAIRMEEPARFTLKGFISDSEDMPGHMLMGTMVFANDEHLIENMRKANTKTLLVSPLKKNRISENQAMVDRLIEAGITLYTLNLAQTWDGSSDINTSQLQEVQIEDLLPREEIEVDMDVIGNMLRDKCIFITGSAGSIGSEMVRQISKYSPRQLVLVDEAETPQHDIRLMMANDFPGIKAETVVTSITKSRRMESLFKAYRPDYVFHAAAYKHVPMMEDNPSEAVQNNIDGTRVIADLAVKYGVKKFVMISTDKAVNPTNVMGCSKRICEIYVQALNRKLQKEAASTVGAEGKPKEYCQFVTTRFGNVLGSNGSVIPIFKEQIRKGGPVTVTHPDIIRYFMLIPEACKLVLEAGTMGKGGEIFVFDMGQPVKIADLAHRMIRLSGAKNVEVKFTGLRDGEKLYEEVLNDEELTKPTFHKKIKIAQVREYDYETAAAQIDALVAQSYLYDDMETVRLMKQIVPEYKSKQSKYEELDKEES
ncbi:MAG: polysaccharide biosynthesis protein [Bacteroidaceae bacterium]|nr:polysaccharide biosynthesis protein [Bacteroidaceae bacterium]